VRQVWMQEIPTVSKRFKWRVCPLWRIHYPMGCLLMTDDYPVVTELAALPAWVLESMIHLLRRDSDTPSVLRCAILRETAEAALRQKTEATE